MKADIHPKYQAATVHCACGNTLETRSTQPSIQAEICSACHPYFTGRQERVDTAGRAERVRQRYGAQGAPKQAARRRGWPRRLRICPGRVLARGAGGWMRARIQEIEQRHEEIASMLGGPAVIGDPNRLREIAREHSHLSGTVAAIQRFRRLEAELADARAMVAEAGADA